MVRFCRGDSFENGFPDVCFERLTTSKGDLLRKPAVLETKTRTVAGTEIEFVQELKGEQWLVHVVAGPMKRGM